MRRLSQTQSAQLPIRQTGAPGPGRAPAPHNIGHKTHHTHARRHSGRARAHASAHIHPNTNRNTKGTVVHFSISSTTFANNVPNLLPMIPLFSAPRTQTCFRRGYWFRRRCRPMLLQSCPESIRNTIVCTSSAGVPIPVVARFIGRGFIEPRSDAMCAASNRSGRARHSHLALRALTVKVLTKLEATDGGAAPTIPQVCGGVRRCAAVGGWLTRPRNEPCISGLCPMHH